MMRFLGLLTILFIGLKLGGIIDWYWLVVLSPLIASFAIFAVLFVLTFLVALLKD